MLGEEVDVDNLVEDIVAGAAHQMFLKLAYRKTSVKSILHDRIEDGGFCLTGSGNCHFCSAWRCSYRTIRLAASVTGPMKLSSSWLLQWRLHVNSC